jgi:hypothetical protein
MINLADSEIFAVAGRLVSLICRSGSTCGKLA